MKSKFEKWFEENCDGSDLAEEACKKLWDSFYDQINNICRDSYESQQLKINSLERQLSLMSGWEKIAHSNGEEKRRYVGERDKLQDQIDQSILILEDILKMGLIRSSYTLFDLKKVIKGGGL